MQAWSFTVPQARKLVEAKAQISRGQWGQLLNKNFVLSQDMAQRYMRLARRFSDSGLKTAPPRFSLSEAVDPLRVPSHKHRWYGSVREIANRLNIDRIKQEARNRESDNALQRKEFSSKSMDGAALMRLANLEQKEWSRATKLNMTLTEAVDRPQVPSHRPQLHAQLHFCETFLTRLHARLQLDRIHPGSSMVLRGLEYAGKAI